MILHEGFKMSSWTLWTLIHTIMIGSCVAGQCPEPCDCFSAYGCNGTKVSCQYRGLTRVPTDYPSDTCTIDLSANGITSIEIGTFSGLTSLQTLDLSVNAITSIENGTFSGLTSLQTLALYSNKITGIVNGTFSGLTSLQTLSLSSNKITNIESGAFSGLTSLQTLDLRSNKITSIENGALSALTSLRTLYLQSNKITNIENGTFSGMTSLQTLDLDRNGLTIIENDAFRGLTSLHTLDLRSNKITNIENGAFSVMTSLQTLDLSRNSITSIRKDAFGGLTSLRKLYVGRNPFHCDCSLEAFTEFLQKFLPYDSSSHQNPQCTTPNDLSGTELNKVSFEDCTTTTIVTQGNMRSTDTTTLVTMSTTTIVTRGSTRSTDSGTWVTMPTTTIVTRGSTRSTDSDAPVDKASSEEKGLSVIAVAYIITVPLLICVSIAVNFVCYKCGMKKGKTIERKRQLQQFPDDTQTVHYQHYQGDDENVQRAAREQPGPSAGQVSTDASHDYAAYDEIKEQRQRIQTSQRKKDGGYLTPVSQNVNRSLPAVRTDGDGYMSPASATDNRPAGQGKRNSPSPPGNGGYISPLQAENVAERLVSSNSDSSSNKSDKSDKSRKYQNEPRSKSSPTSKSIYQSIKDTGITPEHQYIELKTSAS